MEYHEFSSILNETLLGGERSQLFERMARNPERFIGLFRPSTSRHKLLQNIIQNREIRFGDVIERVFSKWLAEYGYKILNPQITAELLCDLYFLAPNDHAYLVEMKMRDDHDSTKRRGQWDNFELKVKILYRKHGSELTAIFYFVDPALSKNRNFYTANCEKLRRDIQLDTIILWYGSQLFEHLTKTEDWELLLDFLHRWKSELKETEMLNMESAEALRELSSLDIQIWERIANTKAFWDESFIRTLFPSGNGLRQIASEIESRRPSLITTTLRQRINDLYGTA